MVFVQVLFALLGVGLAVDLALVDEKQCTTCQDGWKFHKGNCYRIFKICATYDQAEQSCQRNEGNLVSIHNSDENKFVFDLWKDTFNGNKNLWIGLNDKSKEGQFVWTDDTKWPIDDFNPWVRNQQDNNDGEDCVQLVERGRLAWNVRSCSIVSPYMCKSAPTVAAAEFF